MTNRRKLSTLIALLLAVGLLSVSAARGAASSTLILDKFDEKKTTEITAHTPNTDTVGSGWVVELGIWEVKKGKARERSTAPVIHSSDYRALIDADAADVSAEVKLKIDLSGDQFWGVVVRHSGTHDWIMAFHDGVGDLVLGKKRPDENRFGGTVPTAHPTAGGFQELGRVPMNWNTGKKGRNHTITLETSGDTITVLAAGDPVISATDDDLMTSGFVGIFSRGTGNNQFDKFTVEMN
ncbi:MAG: hypothetical protein O6922_07405 [Chloroflexi bacterium]|nr:hypothetical protein [Chloroflexota bacterium]